jgi:hypothetical protein
MSLYRTHRITADRALGTACPDHVEEAFYLLCQAMRWQVGRRMLPRSVTVVCKARKVTKPRQAFARAVEQLSYPVLAVPAR